MRRRRAARVHAHDRRPGQGDARAARSRSSRRSTASAPARARSSPWRSDLRYRHAEQRRWRSSSSRVGLAGCDMGACAILPRIVGQGRAAELLYTGRVDGRRGGPRLGLLQPAVSADGCSPRRSTSRASSPTGPTFAHAMTKKLLHQEWAMERGRGDRGGSAGAGDLHADAGFRRAYEAFAAKQKPRFEGD